MSLDEHSSAEPALPAQGGVSRRDFLRSAAYGSGALVVALHLPGCSKHDPRNAAAAGPFVANAWLTIAPDDRITFLCDRSEMGQGVYTGLTTLVAEELGIAPDRITIEFAPPGAAYTNALLGGQVTGGSTSVRDAWIKLRTAAAQAREMLVAAAAGQWRVAASECRVEGGSVLGPDGKSATYGALAGAASQLTPPKDVALKSEYSLIGRPSRRLDTPMKVDGSVQYGIDVRLPGMLYAALAQSPVLGG
jgi:isoquinoline 1-oxidoreductase beta subunit